MHPEIIQQQERLERLFRQAEKLQRNDEVDEEIKAQFIWYLCVRTSGYVEFAIKTILRKYVQSNTANSPYVVNFVNDQLRFVRNPSRDQILGLIGKFNTNWKHSLGVKLDRDLGDSLDSTENLTLSCKLPKQPQMPPIG